MLAEKAGQGVVGGFSRRMVSTWVLLGLGVERPWLTLDRPFFTKILSHWITKKNSHIW